MIKINYANSGVSKLPINLCLAFIEVQKTLDAIHKDIDIVPVVTFDPTYTKPANLTSIDVMGETLTNDIDVYFKTYTQNYFSFRYAPVFSHVKNGEPNTIYYNTRIFSWKMSVRDWTSNMFHELTHILDAHSVSTFNHGDNSNGPDKQNCAPQKMSVLLANLADSIKAGGKDVH